MSEWMPQIFASTVVAASVSAAAIIVRELLAGRGRRSDALVESQKHREQKRLDQHEALLREVESLWRHNHDLRTREAACQRRCRALARRLSDLEQRCMGLRNRLDQLARVVGSENATLQPRTSSDCQPA